MKTTELRIGNFVDVTEEYRDMKITSITEEGDINYAYKEQDIEGIPLTEKWLSKFSFNYNDLNGDSGHWQIKSPISIFEILHGEDGFFYEYATEIKYVHELQNLYYALTKQELVLAVTPNEVQK